MTSLGDESFGNIINCNTLRYGNLEPPIGGFVNNPLTGDLQCGGNNISGAGAITTGTLNYTTLNPPIPTGFIVNPMVANLDAGNFNISNVNSFDTNGSITAVGNVTGNGLVSTSTLTSSFGEITNNFQVGGTTILNSANVSNNLAVDQIMRTNDFRIINPSGFGSPSSLQDLSTIPQISIGNKTRVVVYGFNNSNNVISIALNTGVTDAISKFSFIVSSQQLVPVAGGITDVSQQNYFISPAPGASGLILVQINYSGNPVSTNPQRINILCIRD